MQWGDQATGVELPSSANHANLPTFLQTYIYTRVRVRVYI